MTQAVNWKGKLHSRKHTRYITSIRSQRKNGELKMRDKHWSSVLSVSENSLSSPTTTPTKNECIMQKNWENLHKILLYFTTCRSSKKTKHFLPNQKHEVKAALPCTAPINYYNFSWKTPQPRKKLPKHLCR